jgi:chromosome segregation ATPase
MTDYDDLLARAEMAESAMDNLARKLTATERERDEARGELARVQHLPELNRVVDEVVAARAEARAAQAHVAMLREAIEGLAEAVASDADERRSISGRVGARLTDAHAALSATDAEALEFVEGVREEARREAIEDALAEMCEHVGRVVEPGLVTEIRNEFALLAQPAEPSAGYALCVNHQTPRDDCPMCLPSERGGG